MGAQHYTGSDEELQVILDGAPGPAGLFPHALGVRLADWRDAAVARRLSEAGAVHPAVHTPTRVMNYLERHDWVRFNVSDVAILWFHPDVPTACGWSLCMPMTTEAADYSYRVLEIVRELWRTSQSLESEILLEIASMPDEVAW